MDSRFKLAYLLFPLVLLAGCTPWEILDAATGQPLEDVQVRIEAYPLVQGGGLGSPPQTFEAVTGRDGRFETPDWVMQNMHNPASRMNLVKAGYVADAFKTAGRRDQDPEGWQRHPVIYMRTMTEADRQEEEARRQMEEQIRELKEGKMPAMMAPAPVLKAVRAAPTQNCIAAQSAAPAGATRPAPAVVRCQGPAASPPR